MLNYNSEKEDVLKLTHDCNCDACEHPCKYGSGAFVKDEVKKLAEFLDMTEKDVKEKYLDEIKKFNTTLFRPKLKTKKNKPFGKCVFFDKGCKIHNVKPLECKIAMSCKTYGKDLITWFNLKHYLNPNDPKSMREFKLYVESGGQVLQQMQHIIEKLEKVNYDDLKIEKDWDEVLGIKELMKDIKEASKNGK